jgi:Cysteine rich repeat
MTHIRTLAIAIAMTVPTLALAQQAGSVREACQNDIKTLCANVEPGRGHVRECMQANQAKLSAPCKDAIAQRAARRQDNAAPAGGTQKQ